MVETNEQKKPEEVERERKDRKRKEYSIDEIRTKLIEKLPQMEGHIKKLNDKEVRQIY